MTNIPPVSTGIGERVGHYLQPKPDNVSAYDMNSLTLRQLHFPYPSEEQMTAARAAFRQVEVDYRGVFGYGKGEGGYEYKHYCNHRDYPTIAIATDTATKAHKQVQEKQRSPLDVLGRRNLEAVGVVWDDDLLRNIFEPKTYYLFGLVDKLPQEKREALAAVFMARLTPNTGGGEVDFLLAPYFGGMGLAHRHLKRLSAACYRDFGGFMSASKPVRAALFSSLISHNVESMPNGRPNPQQLKGFVNGLLEQPNLTYEDKLAMREKTLEMLAANRPQANIFSST